MRYASPAVPPVMRLLRSRSGAAITEFALSLPLFLGVGLFGLESANQAIVQMRVSQVAAQIADNASRIGDTSTLENRRIYESDINDSFLGSNVQGGVKLEIFEHGRIILSSLEVAPDSEDRQYIHWQRCKGKKRHPSSYGESGDGIIGDMPGMGPPGQEIFAFNGGAVMFVEISYDYQPLVSELFAHVETLSATAAFNVRDDRDLSQVYQRDPLNHDEVASCDKHDGADTITV